MRVAATIILIVTIASLILWVRGGEAFHIARSFPLLGGPVTHWLYPVAGLVMVLMALRGLGRLLSGQSDEPDDEPEEEWPSDDEDEFDDEREDAGEDEDGDDA